LYVFWLPQRCMMEDPVRSGFFFLVQLAKALGYLMKAGGIKKNKPTIMKPLLSLTAVGIFTFLISCQNNADEKQAVAALTDSTSLTGLTGDAVKLVKTASIHFKVNDVEQSARTVSRIAQQLGGMIYHQNLESIEGQRKELKVSSDSLMVITAYTPQADITARIPSQNLEAFMYSMADLGYYTNNSKMDIADKSLTYLENALKQKNRIEALSRPTPIKTKAVSTLQAIALKDEVIAQGINNRAIDADVDYSTVNLSLFQNPLVRKETIANYYISGYTLPFHKRWANAMREGWAYFLNFLLMVTHLWVFIVVALLFWISYRYWQQKRKLIL
jgi:hypothetical protein